MSEIACCHSLQASLQGQGVPRFAHEWDAVEVAGISLSQCIYPAGTTLGDHAHSNAVLNLTLAGSWNEAGSGGRYRCVPGMVTFQPPRSAHRVLVNSDYSHGFHVEIPASVLSELDSIPAAGIGEGDELARLVEELHNEYRQRQPLCEMAMESITLEALSYLFRVGCMDRGVPPWLNRAADYLREHYDKTVSLGELSREAGVSAVRLTRHFRRVLGVTPAQYQRGVRMRLAARQIRGGEGALVDVAMRCGFADQPHLTRSFQRWIGETPAAYRKRLQHTN